MGILKVEISIVPQFRCFQDAHGLLVNFESFSTEYLTQLTFQV